MVHTSMYVVYVDIHNVSIHGWANIYLQIFPTTIPTKILRPTCLPDQPQTLEDSVQCLCLGEFLALSAQGELNSSHP
jgi:hypothetical protein